MSINFKTSQKQRHPSQKPEQWVLWTNPLWQAEYSSPHLEWNRKKCVKFRDDNSTHDTQR